ncbi:CLUMA_CG008584, isoform A [Clunio marinus]|uniref:CLUMA_CG008584, isoform A n=1 Tax=Clunio marinus TaxID=568069 RepID=A0A1J1I5U0_9DIPT|nr:CLUMA_CG008584, isoform A [Clunio marinus]
MKVLIKITCKLNYLNTIHAFMFLTFLMQCDQIYIQPPIVDVDTGRSEKGSSTFPDNFCRMLEAADRTGVDATTDGGENVDFFDC